MFYLMTHSTHTIYVYVSVRHIVKNHLDSETGNLLLPVSYASELIAVDVLYAVSHIQDNTYHSLWYTSCEALVGMEKAQC